MIGPLTVLWLPLLLLLLLLLLFQVGGVLNSYGWVPPMIKNDQATFNLAQRIYFRKGSSTALTSTDPIILSYLLLLLSYLHLYLRCYLHFIYS